MSPEPEVFLAVLKASYDYDPQSDDEIAIKEDQLLFLKEKVDDDWWKVKVKGDTQDDDTPVGLVPAAYVEQAEHTSTVKVLYDYEAAASGELSVQEDEILLVFEREQDWLLVQSQKEGGGAGFVPGNYVEAYTEEETPPATVSPQIVVPPPAPRPVSTYVDPADRVASARVTADGIKTWSVSEIDKKGKKKKGTLGIGNGAVFFASESDKTPVQKWQTADVQNTSSEKAKHVNIDIGGGTPINLHFHAGSKDNVDEIIEKLNSSKALSAPPHSPGPSDTSPTPDSPPPREMKKASVHFSNSSPVIIPSAQDEQEEEEEEEEEAPQVKGPSVNGRQPSRGGDNDAETGLALYDFSADGDDELSITAGERLTILERDSDEWWKCRNSKGTEGVVPAQYIEASASLAPAAQSSRAAQVSHEEEEEEDTAAAEEEARRAAEEARLAREQEKQRAEEARKKLEAQKRAKEAAAAAEAERKRRKEASAARVSSPPASEPKRKSADNGSASTSGRPSTEANRPPPERTRVWHDRSGQFRVEAAFLGFNNGKLRLHKVNGVIVEVPSEKMSVEDMQYVERLTSKKSRPPPTKQMSDDDIPLGLSHPSSGSVPNSARAAPPKKVSKIDWFDFFLSAGCDLDDCTRYSASFERDKMDETLLPDITDATMRSLGVREGDIIRIKKAIEKRKPNDNLVKPSPYAEEQVRRDEELARQLQAQETGGTRSPAPNLFAGPGGVLKNPRRGRPQPSKSLPLSSVDIKAISTVSDQVLRTSSPQILTPTSAPSSSAPVAAPPRSSSAVPVASGFDDDAWTNRPSSTKPLVGTPAPRAPSAPPAATAPASVSAPSAPISQPAPTATTSALSAQPTSTMPLAKTTESDIFDQLSRLSELRKQSTPMQPPPSTSPSITVPPSYPAGLGMGSSPAPISQLLQNPQLNVPQQQLQPYNGPRGPFAPVPSNQGLLQPLIPTHTGFSNFIPTRPGPAVSPFQNPVSQPSFLTQQPTGMPSMQPMVSQPTGMPFNGYNPMQSTGAFPPVQSQFTGFNPNFGRSPFSSASSPPPPIPPLPSNTNNTSPANIFAQMKSGTFATDNNSNPQPSVLTAQATGWGQPYQGGYTGYQH